ncbi:hypothetical protein ZIOFF_026896 [Zingiber officinale]|uniref:Uncharacterized protein n=1 Tax=Zingiber officinale TaxID=94328 RepID=A0A8J5H6G0_ZINOF|nr:hypothetical protein ZIOFF_026896 [Zingiber officinale]
MAPSLALMLPRLLLPFLFLALFHLIAIGRPISTPADEALADLLLSDGITPGSTSDSQTLLLPFLRRPTISQIFAADQCEQTYGFLPCTTTVVGNMFLIVVYGFLMYKAATYLSSGSELLLKIMGPGIVGGLFLPILGALPDAMLILDEGVERQLTVRYTPQQNGVTERKNQTIVEMAKSMMHEKGLPKIFWAEAVYTAVYLSNRCPTTAIPNKTPFEAWSGRRPSVNHLKVFGSICYSQIPKQKRSKLDESSERCIFVGYSTMSKGYRLFNLQLGQVIISRDVQVDENALWNWEENKVEKKDILISTDKEDEIEPSTPDSSSSQPNEESSTDPTSSNSSSPSATPKRYRSLSDIYATCNYCSIEPENFAEAIKEEPWKKAMEEESPSHFHLGAAKRVLRYVQGTTDLGLSFQKNHALNLVGYCDSDLGGSLDDMKSTSGYCFSFGSAIFSWVSKKQQSVAQSSAEAEYISASVATSQAIWLRKILADLGHHQIEGTVLHCDNKSAIAMAKNPVHHNRTRHIALKHHFIRQAIEDKEIQLDLWIEFEAMRIFKLLDDGLRNLNRAIGASFENLFSGSFVSGISGSKETAQNQVSIGMGLLAGSTVMLLTTLWGSCIIVGKSDLSDNSTSIDPQDTQIFSLFGSGVSTDVETSYAARIMVISIIPFVIVQLPQVFNFPSGQRLAVLLSLIVAVALLVSYCVYQVFQPWIQRRRLAYVKHKHVISGILKHAQMQALGRLVDNEGTPNVDVLKRLFRSLDMDSDRSLSRAELRALIIGLQVDEIDLDMDDAVDKIMDEFDTSRNSTIEEHEFIAGISNWLTEAKRDVGNASSYSKNFMDDFHTKARGEHDRLIYQNDEVVERIDNPGQVVSNAILLLLLGTVLAAIFADPLVDAVDNFSLATSIPSFFISFIAMPLATNASEAVSSIIFASRKKQRTSSLTFSEIYGGVTMNNTLCLAVFLALVYLRHLTWDFSAEVLIILIVCVVMGLFTSFRTTFPLWTCFLAFLFYPLSLILVYVLDFVFGWS